MRRVALAIALGLVLGAVLARCGGPLTMGTLNYGNRSTRETVTRGVARGVALYARLLRTRGAKRAAVQRRLAAWLERATPGEQLAYYRAIIPVRLDHWERR
jgi:hypothetical protein